MNMRNLDVTTLRSFIAVADTGGVTRAAGQLNLTQSAVSMQVKRLEDMLGQTLLERANRSVSLTASGQQLLGYARRIVEVNDDAISRLTDQVFEGEIVLGVPHDVVYPVIPKVLQRFHAQYPRMRVNLQSSYTTGLKRQYAHGEINVILTTEGGLDAGGETLDEVPLRWIGAPGGSAWKRRPLRLAYCRYCKFRDGDIGRLDDEGIEWEMAVDSDSDRTVEATVSADLAITSMLEGHAPPHLECINSGGELPDLGMQKINLYGGQARDEIQRDLCAMIREGFAAR